MERLNLPILELMSKIHYLKEEVISQINKNRENIWNQQKNIIKIAQYFQKIKNLDSEGFTIFQNQSKISVNLLRENETELMEFIYRVKIDEYFKDFKILMESFTWFIFERYFYYNIYDAFSENSRNNEEKARIIMRLADRQPAGKNSVILEIGPGTGPLMRRLLIKGYKVFGIDKDDRMLAELLRMYPNARGKLIHGNIFEYPLGQEKFDIIYIESGVFLFTRLSQSERFLESECVFEIDSGMDWSTIRDGFFKIFNGLKTSGLLLIGTQGLMKKVPVGDNLYFSMERIQLKDRARRTLTYYQKKGLFSRKKIFHVIKQEKPTIPFNEFESLAKSIGFRDIKISENNQFVIVLCKDTTHFSVYEELPCLLSNFFLLP